MINIIKISFSVYPLLSIVSFFGVVISGSVFIKRLFSFSARRNCAKNHVATYESGMRLTEDLLGRCMMVVWWLCFCAQMIEISLASRYCCVITTPFAQLSDLDVIALFCTGGLNGITFVTCVISENLRNRIVHFNKSANGKTPAD